MKNEEYYKILDLLLEDKQIDKKLLIDAINISKNIKDTEKEELENLKNFFLKRIQHINKNSKEYLFENDKIFIVDILSGEFIEGFVSYLKRIFSIIDVTNVIKEGYDRFVIEFFNNFQEKFIPEIIKKLIDIDYLMKSDFFIFRNHLNWIWEIYSKLKLPEKDKSRIFTQELIKLIKILIEMDRISDVLFVELMTYSIAIQGVEDMYNDFVEIENKICKPCQNYYRDWVKRNNLSKIDKFTKKQKDKIKLAFIRPVLTYWSPFKLEYSLIKKLLEDEEFCKKYEIYFYTMSMEEELGTENGEIACINFLKTLNIKVLAPVMHYNQFSHYCDYVKKVLEFREKLIKDEIDIVIYSDHFYSVGEFLFISRVAPKQIYWAHMNTVVNFKEIDKKIIHFPPPKECEKEFEYFDLELDPIFFEGEKEKWKKEAEKIRKRFPEGTIILGSIGRMVKVDNWDYLTTVAEILKSNPDTVYLACGPGETRGIKEKIKKLGIEDRFYFEGWVDPKVYSFVIDIYLNTFPNWSGEVVREYQRLNPDGVIISLKR